MARLAILDAPLDCSGAGRAEEHAPAALRAAGLAACLGARDAGEADARIIGCGSGEFCVPAASRGADASGIDAAEGMIEIPEPRRRFAGPTAHIASRTASAI